MGGLEGVRWRVSVLEGVMEDGTYSYAMEGWGGDNGNVMATQP